ncbi:unnamed protein product [Blepharisma stoltei]|uniref:MARVEL domain-containing protein n=1 Tax=Blepharisma stoltei TaxID=1481888 RepID=A0AAU9KQC3_9CILI|nr:unnamed protein product [Blepharisma stoltei]
MVDKKVTWLGRYRVATALILGALELAYVVALTLILLSNENDCDMPIRLWLQVLLSVFCFHLILLVAAEISTPHCSYHLSNSLSLFSASLNAILGTFMVVWFILGNIWYYSANSSCKDDFYEGYMATFVILIVYYVFLASACCMGCLLIILISLGSGITSKAADY